MRKLSVQLQPARSPGMDVDHILAGLRTIPGFVAIDSGNDNGPYINVGYASDELGEVWKSIQRVSQADTEFAACTIIVCTGEQGWDDYLLLHHYKPSEPLDQLE